MTDCDRTTVKDKTSGLCPSSNESNACIDEIPSLDALSFEHEHCPSRNCLCHNRRHVHNNRNNSGLSAFGVRTNTAPIPAYSRCTTAVTDPVAQGSFQPLMNGCSVIAQPDTDAVCATNTCDRVFGTEHTHRNVEGMQSFAQLCSTGDRSTSEIAATSQSPAFEHSHRGSQFSNDPSQDIDLSELHSMLPTTPEESLSVSECPVHRHHPHAIERIPACTCGQQAARLDDCTFDELAAYFDNFCYIPKNMSPMAEMMYM